MSDDRLSNLAARLLGVAHSGADLLDAERATLKEAAAFMIDALETRSAGVSILKAEAPKPTMEKVFNQFEVPAMPSPEPGATPIRQAWLDMVAYHASRGLPGFCCSWAAFNNIVGALVASSAVVECPECNVRFDPTWNRRAK